MSKPVVAFFNNKGGVGKTSLVYHLAWMYAELGVSVLAADLDPQANLTAAFVDEQRLEDIWAGTDAGTIYGCLQPLIQGTGDVAEAQLEVVDDNLSLIVGDLALSSFEDELSTVWPGCLDRKERAFRVTSAFWRVMQIAATGCGAELVLMDMGPNLGAVNRAALLAADFVVVPLSPDLFSLQGLRNLGPTLRRWRSEWRDRRERCDVPGLDLPRGEMHPLGYVVLQHSVRLDRPVKAYDRWIARIPPEYHRSILGETNSDFFNLENDPERLAQLKHYRSLMPLSQEARKPMFSLRPADGAIGAHVQAVQGAHNDFKRLALRVRTAMESASPLIVG